MTRESCADNGDADLGSNFESEVQPGTNRESTPLDANEQMATQPNRRPLSSHDHPLGIPSPFAVEKPEHNASCAPEIGESSGGTEKDRRNRLSSKISKLSIKSHTPAKPDGPKEKSSTGMLLPVCLLHVDGAHLLHTAPANPPVTTATLKELDLKWIQNNINLRIDIHFDHDLHFMPVSGARREEKEIEAEQYWRSLAIEFRIYQHNNSFKDCSVCRESEPQLQKPFDQRLPIMFTELRALLISLVPEDDRQEVEHNLEVDLVMQQVRKGVLDVVRLSNWLAELLTTHCAPIRDELAEDMAQKVTEGACQGDMGSLVSGLEKLFTFLEAMKLDVANHQIRTFRYPLIEDGVAFQQEYFATRIDNHKLDIGESRDWYKSMRLEGVSGSSGKASGIDALVHGLASLCIYQTSPIPATLKHDLSRIRQLQEEVQDILHLQVCLEIFDDLVSRHRGRDYPIGAMHRAHQARRILTLTDDNNSGDATISDIWNRHVVPISDEITQAADALGPQTGSTIPESAFEETADMIQERFADERACNDGAKRLSRSLEQMTMASVREFQQMSALSISEVQRHYQETRLSTSRGRLIPEVKDISRRLAHMAVIHWRVWCNLAYCDTQDS